VPYWLSTPSLTLHGLRGISHWCFPKPFKTWRFLSQAWSPLQSLTCRTPPDPAGSGSSLEVSSPTGFSATGVHSTRGYLTRYVPLPGFLNLLAASSSRSLPALFHAGTPLGVHPSGLFPLEEPVPSRALFLSCRWAISWKLQDTFGVSLGSASFSSIFRAFTAPPDRAGSDTSVWASGIVPKVVQRFPRPASR